MLQVATFFFCTSCATLGDPHLKGGSFAIFSLRVCVARRWTPQPGESSSGVASPEIVLTSRQKRDLSQRQVGEETAQGQESTSVEPSSAPSGLAQRVAAPAPLLATASASSVHSRTGSSSGTPRQVSRSNSTNSISTPRSAQRIDELSAQLERVLSS